MPFPGVTNLAACASRDHWLSRPSSRVLAFRGHDFTNQTVRYPVGERCKSSRGLLQELGPPQLARAGRVPVSCCCCSCSPQPAGQCLYKTQHLAFVLVPAVTDKPQKSIALCLPLFYLAVAGGMERGRVPMECCGCSFNPGPLLNQSCWSRHIVLLGYQIIQLLLGEVVCL